MHIPYAFKNIITKDIDIIHLQMLVFVLQQNDKNHIKSTITCLLEQLS